MGRVDDVREALGRYAVFVCPILSGSGVRVKLLEAFAAGIPVVSTTIGAEGLAHRGSDYLELADDAESFADRVCGLLADPVRSRAMARRARREVEQNWDMAVVAAKLERHYRDVLEAKAKNHNSPHQEPFPGFD